MKIIIVLLSVLLLCVAGSEGPYFPWINLLSTGCLMLLASKALNSRR